LRTDQVSGLQGPRETTITVSGPVEPALMNEGHWFSRPHRVNPLGL
jgi:hypothetical protein